MDGSAGESVVRRIAAHCIARKGFAWDVPPEAAELKEACDIVLTRLHWSQLHIVCLVDGETHPGKRFALAPERAEAIAQACVKYCGSVSFIAKMPVLLEIIEVSPGVLSDAACDRLRRYRRSSVVSKGMLVATHVDSAARKVWRNRWPRNYTVARRALRAPLPSEGEVQRALASRTALMPVQSGWPVVTFGILALLLVIFSLETIAAQGATPGSVTLVRLGGINSKLVFAGEWWRVVAATVLHANLGHLVANGIALLLAASVLEIMVGRAWFAAIYVVSSLTGALMSVVLGRMFFVSVGASGAIMGVVAAATLLGFVRRRQEFGGEAIRLLTSVLIPTLGTAVWGGPAARHVDHFAHYGGAVGGALMGLAMLAFWKRSDPVPGHRAVAQAIACAGCLALAAAAVEVVSHRASNDLANLPAMDAMVTAARQSLWR